MLGEILDRECDIAPTKRRQEGHWIAEGFASMEAFLLNEQRHGRHVFGDQATMADCCLVPQVFNAQRYQCDLAPYPTIMRIFEACMKLDAFIDAQPSRQPDAA